MKNLNAEQIMKGLECCASYDRDASCGECPYMYAELADNEICSNRMAEDALSLIKELTEENERLVKALDTMSADHNRAISLTETYTVRKMQKRLLGKFNICDKAMYSQVTVHDVINQIAKEMLEGEND